MGIGHDRRIGGVDSEQQRLNQVVVIATHRAGQYRAVQAAVSDACCQSMPSSLRGPPRFGYFRGQRRASGGWRAAGVHCHHQISQEQAREVQYRALYGRRAGWSSCDDLTMAESRDQAAQRW